MSDERREQRAVALKYDGGREAPRVVAKGEGWLADRIVELGREAGVPLYEEPELVKLLARLDLGEQIPVELYRAVAEVLAFVYGLRHRQPPSADLLPPQPGRHR